MNKRNRRFASEDILAIEELAEQLSAELDGADIDAMDDNDFADAADEDIVPIDEDGINGCGDSAADIVSAANELLNELPDDASDPVMTGADEEAKEVLGEADELEACIAEAEEKQDIIDAADELEKEIDGCTAGETCPECGEENCKCGRTASEFAPGIEDEIGDEANGGDPSVSDIVDNDIDVSTDKEVFGQNTDSEYVAKITARLDRVATALEKRGMKKMAFRVDQLSDRLEASVR